MLTVLQGRVEIIFPNIWRLRNINAIENNCRRKQLASKLATERSNKDWPGEKDFSSIFPITGETQKTIEQRIFLKYAVLIG